MRSCRVEFVLFKENNNKTCINENPTILLSIVLFLSFLFLPLSFFLRSRSVMQLKSKTLNSKRLFFFDFPLFSLYLVSKVFHILCVWKKLGKSHTFLNLWKTKFKFIKREKEKREKKILRSNNNNFSHYCQCIWLVQLYKLVCVSKYINNKKKSICMEKISIYETFGLMRLHGTDSTIRMILQIIYSLHITMHSHKKIMGTEYEKELRILSENSNTQIYQIHIILR